MTGAGFENFSKSERTESCVSPRATAGDDQPGAIHFATFGQIASAVDAIVNVNDSPFFVKSFTILTTVAGATAVVHVKHSESPAGPILN